jgi:hypothetical protein
MFSHPDLVSGQVGGEVILYYFKRRRCGGAAPEQPFKQAHLAHLPPRHGGKLI